MPRSLGGGSQTYRDLLAVSLSEFTRSVGFQSWVGFGKGRAQGNGRAEPGSPFGAVVGLLTQSVLCFASLRPAGALEGLGLPPRPRRPLFSATFCRLQRPSWGGSGGKQDSRKGNLI